MSEDSIIDFRPWKISEGESKQKAKTIKNKYRMEQNGIEQNRTE